jgi:translation elongation factor EF-1alpha
MADVKAGKITHYFDRIGVAVVELTDTLKTGDQIRIGGISEDFQMTVSSMQVEHEQLEEAKKGDTIGMKVDQPVKVGDEVFKLI